jgi:hypothetical protein
LALLPPNQHQWQSPYFPQHPPYRIKERLRQKNLMMEALIWKEILICDLQNGHDIAQKIL